MLEALVVAIRELKEIQSKFFVTSIYCVFFDRFLKVTPVFRYLFTKSERKTPLKAEVDANNR